MLQLIRKIFGLSPIPYLSYFVDECTTKFIIRMDDEFFPIGDSQYVLTIEELLKHTIHLIETSDDINEAAKWEGKRNIFPKRRSEYSKFLTIKTK